MLLDNRFKTTLCVPRESPGRFLTSWEALGIQGFESSDFAKVSISALSKSQRFKLVGNAIHVGVLEAILKPCIAMLRVQ
jgi:site-specific DNA-cytosine methylase